MSSNPDLFVVIGDAHARVGLALTALAKIEKEQGAQDCSGLFCRRPWTVSQREGLGLLHWP
jgi:hypothetical protein